METISNALFGSWELNPGLLMPTATFGALYARGWLQLHRRAPDRFGFSQLTAFFAGLITIVFALCSPLHEFAMAADCSHDSTSVVDDGGASTHSVGRSLLATSFRAPSRSFDLWRRAVAIVSRSAKRGSFRVTPDLLLVSFYLDEYRLASSCDV